MEVRSISESPRSCRVSTAPSSISIHVSVGGDSNEQRTRWAFSGPARIVPPAIFAQPQLLVVVDTEEQFDWMKPFDRGERDVSHMRSIERFQSVCDAAGIRPVYVVDHPIAMGDESIAALRAILARGGCEIGAHLHPWVSPPFDEEVNAWNSYPGNLPRALEREKLLRLTDAIERAFGVRTRIYKSGRYGFGANTAAILAELGFEIDLSAAPPFDFAADGGPDWSRAPVDPHWIGSRNEIFAVPCTGAFVGWAGASSHVLHGAAHGSVGRALKLGGILARLGAVERIALSPEGYSKADLERLTRALFERGTRVFSFSIHSPSVEPGHTPYVRDETELHSLLAVCRDYFRYFKTEFGGVSTTASELLHHVRTNTSQHPA